METVHRMFIRAGLLLCLAASGSSFRCERENSWGWTQIFQCPEAGDDPDKLFCCGFGDNKYCCSTAVDEDLIEEFFDHLPTVLAIIGGIIVTVIVLCIVCCCCCPFCLLYKHRNRGTVHNPNPEVSVMQPLQTQSQTYPPPQQQPPYPAQPMPMHPSQAGYPPQPYPPAGYPPQPYPPTGYPNEQPPMYTEKQPPPYNPTY